MKKYRKKPVVIEAVQWNGFNVSEIIEFVGESLQCTCETGINTLPTVDMFINTLEGVHHCSIGDFIIKGVNGEFYPCKPDIFEKTYDEVCDD